VVKNGIAEKLTVHTGVSDGDLMEVLGSIAVGDQVIVSSPAGLKSGTAVTATSTAAAVVSENK
jgi:hypothetical protein